jgi:ferric-dicitrate binding protein FerR (iron transport regulator)
LKARTMSEWMDRLVRESRADLGTKESRDIDWAELDRALFRRIEAEQRAERAELAPRRAGRWALVVFGLSVAAAVALLEMGTTRVASVIEGAPGQAVAAEDSAGRVVAVEGGGQLLVNGKMAAVGASLHGGDVIEARGAQVTVERPGKLTWVFERGAEGTVTHAQGALVLALQVGAVEAQVVPVPSGEAFAVDVGSSRVAAHGTHLRVARVGEHVVVDLSEGVASVGEAPRTGSTLGALVTAPAHAEFTIGDVEGTMAVTHDPAALRAPLSLGSSTPSRGGFPPSVALSAVPKAELTGARSTGGAARPEGHAVSAASARNVALAEIPADVAIAAAVRSCLAERPRADNVTVVVSTTVHLALGSDGTVRSARFDPPVAPDVNACASGAIYKARFGQAGSVDIPVDLTLPSSAP